MSEDYAAHLATRIIVAVLANGFGSAATYGLLWCIFHRDRDWKTKGRDRWAFILLGCTATGIIRDVSAHFEPHCYMVTERESAPVQEVVPGGDW